MVQAILPGWVSWEGNVLVNVTDINYVYANGLLSSYFVKIYLVYAKRR